MLHNPLLIVWVIWDYSNNNPYFTTCLIRYLTIYCTCYVYYIWLYSLQGAMSKSGDPFLVEISSTTEFQRRFQLIVMKLCKEILLFSHSHHQISLSWHFSFDWVDKSDTNNMHELSFWDHNVAKSLQCNERFKFDCNKLIKWDKQSN